MKRCLVVLLLVAVAAPLQAQSAERIEAARALVDAMDTAETMQESAELGMQNELARNPQLSGYSDIVNKYVEMALDWDEISEDVIRTYANHFTADELRQLTAFYQSPIGQRFVEVSPQLNASIQEITARRMQNVMPQMQQELMQRMMEDAGGG